MTRHRGPRALTLLALAASFVAGAAVDRWLRTYGPPQPVQQAVDDIQLKRETTGNSAPGQAGVKPDTIGTIGADPSPLPPDTIGTVGADPARLPPDSPGSPAGSLPHSALRVPIDGVRYESFRGGFAETRNGSRPHEAVDILVPRGTPVHAVVDGTVAKLFFSKAGGTTIYEFDPDGVLCYYYAHLDRYADGLHEGQHLSQGEVIGYVGTSGNAPVDAPHLHFAVFELNADRHWWQGKALDPYLVFQHNGLP